jgi:3-deoxy-D-manno-octulosonate 8-phosphate phosphatase (KDO 8-P phosphatase)
MNEINEINFKKSELGENIKLIITDIDGVLTNGSFTILDDNLETKQFNTKDGQLMQQVNNLYITACISGRGGRIVKDRMDTLGFYDIHLNIKNKLETYKKLKEKYKLKDSEIAYIGDDIIDLEILSRVGFAAAPKDSECVVLDFLKIREKNDTNSENESFQKTYITTRNGGKGAFRDFINKLLTITIK